jgi:hypothetical protein
VETLVYSGVRGSLEQFVGGIRHSSVDDDVNVDVAGLFFVYASEHQSH